MHIADVSNEKVMLSLDIKLPAKFFLFLYAILPITWLVAFADLAVFNRKIANSLPGSPEDMYVFLLFFSMPHVFASLFSYFDVEYLRFYKKRIIIPVFLLTLMVLFAPSIIGEELLMAIIVTWTMTHLVAQQFGISVMLTRKKDFRYIIWKTFAMIVASIIYLDIMMHIGERFLLSSMINNLLMLLMIPCTIATIMYSTKCKGKLGITAIWLNYAWILTSFFFHRMGFSFLTVLCARVIHDPTAIICYSIHDNNRNKTQPRNFLYRSLMWIGLPIVILCPLLAFSTNYLLQHLINERALLVFMLWASVLHYYCEGFSWKNGSIHRRFVTIK